MKITRTILLSLAAMWLGGFSAPANAGSIPERPGTSALTVVISGDGMVSPQSDGKLLTVGKTYSVTAVPHAGSVFNFWSGNFSSTNLYGPKVSFVMQPGLVVQANFISNPFTNHTGYYYGLLAEAGGVQTESSGCFSLRLAPNGVFSGAVTLGGKLYPFQGSYLVPQFFPISLTEVAALDPARAVVKRGTNPPLYLTFNLDFAGDSDQITGSITDNNWSADLLANRAVLNAHSNPAPWAQQYTMVLHGAPDASASPAGDGYATIQLFSSGTVRMNGKVADGTVINQQATVSKDGLWPFYVSLYGGQGSIMGWLTFTNGNNLDPNPIRGDLIWTKPPMTNSTYYPLGFTNIVPVVGSRYTNGTTLSIFTSATALLRGGNLAEGTLTSSVPTAKARALSFSFSDSVSLTLFFDSSSGRVNGTLSETGTNPRNLSGVLLPEQNYIRGFFLGTNQSGVFFIFQ